MFLNLVFWRKMIVKRETKVSSSLNAWPFQGKTPRLTKGKISFIIKSVDRLVQYSLLQATIGLTYFIETHIISLLTKN